MCATKSSTASGNTIVTEGWDDPKLRAERFQHRQLERPALYGLRASIRLANDIGLDRIERRHRKLADYILDEMKKRGAESWTSPTALRCANRNRKRPARPRMDLENWMWKNHKSEIRAVYQSCDSRALYLQKNNIDRFLESLMSTGGRRSFLEEE